MAKRHAWLVGALADKGYTQADLARAWKVDDAVASRFIGTGKPDITIERQLMLATMLDMDANELVARLMHGLAPMKPPPKPSAPIPAARGGSGSGGDVEAAHADLKRAADALQSQLPGATVTVTINYGQK